MDDMTREHDVPPANRDTVSRPARRVGIKRVLGLTVGGLVVLGMIAGGTLYWLNARDFETTDDAFVDTYTTQVAPRVAGQVTRLLFADNQHVTAGDTLLLIDPRDFQAKLDQAKAQQASAEATLTQAQAQVFVQQANIDQANANVRVAESDLLQARQDHDRYHNITPARSAGSRSTPRTPRSIPLRRNSTPAARWWGARRRRSAPRRPRCRQLRLRCSRPSRPPRWRRCSFLIARSWRRSLAS